MIRFYNFSLLMCLSFSFYGQYVPGTAQSIAGYGNYHPQIMVNSLHQPFAIWTDGSSGNLYKSLAVDGVFQTPQSINSSVGNVQVFDWSGPDLAFENENVFVVFKEDGYETGHIFLAKSTDNGMNFNQLTDVDEGNTGYAQYPDVAVLNDTVYVTYMQHDAGGINPRYVLSRSFDGGLSFESPVAAGEITGDEACDCCPPEIYVDQDFVLILFRNNANNIRDIKGVISYDRGASFGQVAEIDTHNWFLNACPSSGPDGEINNDNKILFTAYKSSENSIGNVFLNSYDLNLNSSLNTINLSDGLSNPNYPQISVSNDTIGVVFEAGGISRDVYFNYSHAGLNGLIENNRINLSNAQGVQDKPAIIFDQGNFHIIYADMNNLTYLQMVSPAALEELSVSNESACQVFSKSSYQETKLDLEGKICYSLSGEKVTATSIAELALGTYFVYGKGKVQRLIIMP